MTRIVLALLASLALGPRVARADGYAESAFRLPTLVSIGWEVTVPQRGLRTFVDRTSLRGGQVEVAFGVARHLSLGISGSWDWMSQTFPSQSLQVGDAVVTGHSYRRAQIADLRATIYWYLTNGPVQPYLGVGLGGGWHGTYAAVADVVGTRGGWHAAGEPRAGILWTLRPGLALNLQGRYVLTNARIDDVQDARWLAVHLGLALY